MIPVIAIVGRPNVGKSTLFNCLTASRAALVSEVPGMTRDRQYGDATFAGHHFIVIDTGGLTDDREDLHKLTVEQSLQAVVDADKILFLVDGRIGLTAEDKLIANKLRLYEKPISLVINKAEDLDIPIISAEFYQLGLGTPIAISAAHKRGVTELVEQLFKEKIPDDTIIEKDTGIKLAIIGRPNVGKSTLTNRLLGEERVIVYDNPGTTRDSIYIPLQRRGTQYTLIDTAGIRRRGKIFEATEKFSVVKTLQAITAAQVVLFVMDAHEGVTEQDLRLLGFILESGRALVIAMNKWDGLSNDTRGNARTTIDRRLNFLPFIRIHFISALHGTGVGNLFDSVNEAYASATKKLSTPVLTKILQKAVQSHTPPLIKGRRIKLRYAHPGGHNPPTIIIHGNQVTSLPGSYQRFLANTFQERLKLVGTPVQIELKSSENPFQHKRNKLTPLQQRKKSKRMKRMKNKR